MKKDLEKIIKESILSLQKEKIIPGFEIPQIEIRHPKDEQFGDYSANIGMIIGKILKISPLEVAEKIAQNIKDENFSKIEAVAPGYINFYLSKDYLQNLINLINNEKNNFGNNKTGTGIKVNNEFISANPTGPLHLGNGRGGFCGDVISNVLRKNGYEVTNEYYVNDAGEQVVKLGHSVLKDGEAEYAGDYINELNEKFKNISDVSKAGAEAAKIIIEDYIKKSVQEKMKINFDVWISEKEDLENKGYIEKAVSQLKEKKLTYEEEGALWAKTSDFGDDKDRVLIKKDGQKTYFASDCGYILNKIERKFDKFIEIWGADHHGYVKRFEAAAKALDFKGDLKFIIIQLVRLVKDGKEFKMSKREGNVVYIDDLIEEVGLDAARFFFLLYAPETHMNFDLALAKERSEKNPVFYVQYAHARICSILRKAKDESRIMNYESREYLEKLTNTKEFNLIRELNKFPELVEEISENYEVHKLPQYSLKIADKLHSFYDECRVIDETNPELSKARLNLINAVRIVLAETLKLIGVSAPEKM